jgi:hypothetical protein
MESPNGHNGHPTTAEYGIYDIYDLRAMLRGHRNRIEAAMHDAGPIEGADRNRGQWLQEIVHDSYAHIDAIHSALQCRERR